MFYKKILSAVLTLLIISISFQSCSDDPINPSGNTVTGKLVSPENIPVSNADMRIGDKSTLTASDGSFKFDNVSFPYDLSIKTQNRYYFLYKNLSASNYKIPDYFLSPQSWYVGVIYAEIPSSILANGTKGKIIFTDTKEINEIQNIEIHNTINVNLPEFNKDFTGKIYVLTYRTDSEGNILGYENYGESEPINIKTSASVFYSFTKDQLSLNPDEINVSGTITHPPGLTSEYGFYYLAFNTKRINYISDELRFSGIDDVFDFFVPGNLPSNFTIIVSNQATDGFNGTFESFRVNKNSHGINLETQIPPSLISPPDNATDVNASTIFSVDNGSGDGIYRYWFSNNVKNIAVSIMTESKSITFSEVINLIEDDISNTKFYWSVAKIGPNLNINEYMTTYSDKQAYFGSGTGTRTFTTGQVINN